MSLIANGIAADIPWEDAIGVVKILAQTGRTVVPHKWIDCLVQEEMDNEVEGLF